MHSNKENDRLLFLDGVIVLPLLVDGHLFRAGITLDAFTILMQRAGLDPDDGFGGAFTGDVIQKLKPVIETHLQAKHMRQGGQQPLIIESKDMALH